MVGLNFKNIQTQDLPSIKICYNLRVYGVCSSTEEVCKNTRNTFFTLKEEL